MTTGKKKKKKKKKKIAASRAPRANVESTNMKQSAEDQRVAENQLRALIERFAPDHRRLVAAARRTLRKRLPTAYELVYAYRSWFVISFAPSDRGYEGVLAIHCSAEGIKLYFNRGKALPDPDKLLRGSGSVVRWTELEQASTLTRPAIAHLIDEAIAQNPVPFPTERQGSIIIRGASTRKRGKRQGN